MKRSLLSAACLLSIAACDGISGPGNDGRVAVRFETSSSSQVSSNLLSAGDAGVLSDLTVTGTNGTLVIQDVRFIVEQLKLKSSDELSVCDDDDDDEFDDDDNVLVASRDDDGEDDDDDCQFKGGPFIVDLNLDGGATTISTEDVPAGTYDRLHFKVGNLEADDDDDDDESLKVPALLTEMRTVYPDFPSRASLVVKGTQNGQPFIVYFRSKIHVKEAISPPLVVPGDDAITVNLDPERWFKNGTQIVNLLALNGRLIEMGDGFRGGILGTHRGRGHDDDDD